MKSLLHFFVIVFVGIVLAFPILGVSIDQQGMDVTIAFTTPELLFGVGFFILSIAVLAVFRPWQRFIHQNSRGVSFSVAEKVNAFFTKPWVLGCIVLVLFVLPFVVSRVWLDIAILCLIYVLLGLGLNIVVGLAGLLDLGYVAFYAVGAYLYALGSKYFDLSFWLALPLGALFAAFFGFLLGLPVLRLRGDYLAIVTLGFGEIIRLLLNNATEFTGGPNGVGDIPKPDLVWIEFSREASKEGTWLLHELLHVEYSSVYRLMFIYFLLLLFAIWAYLLVSRLLRQSLGRAWEALREDEIAARSLGLNPTVIKLTAFMLGAAFAGVVGVIFAARQSFISPESFVFIESAIILAIVILGGMGNQIGVILAAIVLTALPEILRNFAEYRMILFGLSMVMLMIWRPQGLLPMKRPVFTFKQ